MYEDKFSLRHLSFVRRLFAGPSHCAEVMARRVIPGKSRARIEQDGTDGGSWLTICG